MSLKRRLRGLIGTALTWGAMGGVAGVATFIGVYRPWPLSSMLSWRALTLFAKFETASVVFGIATGLTFGLMILALERTRRWSELTTGRITVWGAVAGGLFPSLLSIRPILTGASPVYFGLIIGASALAGAVWARASFAMARRVPEGPETGTLPRQSAESMTGAALGARERVR